MYIRENIALAISGLIANKMRALLTMLGIIIGISSVIAIVTVGDSMTGMVTSTMNDMGANSIQMGVVDKPDENGEYSGSISGEEKSPSDLITDEMIEQYQDAFAGQVHAVAIGEYTGGGQAKNGRLHANADVRGINEDAFKAVNVDIVQGRSLNEREVKTEKNVAVVSDKTAEKLFPNERNVLGKEFKIHLGEEIHTLSIVGVYHFELSGMLTAMAGDISTQMYIPVTVSKKITGDPAGYEGLQIKAAAGVNLEQFSKQTQDYFNRFYRSNAKYECKTYSMDSMIGQMTSMMDTMSLAISVIAAIALLVGGIGVMNIMLVSVTERTREIGTRKALGAKNSAIRVQFIVESVIICLIGGVIGIILGAGLGRLGSTLLEYPQWPSIWIVLIAVSFSMAIGVFFGYYPANKAAKLDPIEALRYE
ncbi:ABC transporter permease [Oscillospiraceae bacterium PP1C4]